MSLHVLFSFSNQRTEFAICRTNALRHGGAKADDQTECAQSTDRQQRGGGFSHGDRVVGHSLFQVKGIGLSADRQLIVAIVTGKSNVAVGIDDGCREIVPNGFAIAINDRLAVELRRPTIADNVFFDASKSS